MSWEPLVEYRRNGVAEIVVHGAVAWWSGEGLVHSLGGDPLIYGRSMMKPLQFKPLAKTLFPLLTPDQRAVAMGSHNGEPEHVEAARSILPRAERGLVQLPPQTPLVQFGRQIRRPTRWVHPCSGKHAAIIRACGLLGWPRVGYTWPHHPFQVAYEREMNRRLGSPGQSRTMAKDGCGMPTIAMTLSEMARLFASLVPEREDDLIWDAFARRPAMIGGFNRLDTTIVAECNGAVLAKEGADGLLGLALAHPEFPGGLGIVFKLAHGWDAQAAWYIARWTLGVLGFEFRNPYPLFRQKAHVSPRLVPPQLAGRLAAIEPWDSWDPDIDRWPFDATAYRHA